MFFARFQAGEKDTDQQSGLAFEYLGDFLADRRHGIGLFFNDTVAALANWEFDMINGFCILSNSEELKIRGNVENKILQGFSEIVSPKTKFFFQGRIH